MRDEGHDPDTYRFMTVDSASNATIEKTPEPVPIPAVQDEQKSAEGKANGTEPKSTEVTPANTAQAACKIGFSLFIFTIFVCFVLLSLGFRRV